MNNKCGKGIALTIAMSLGLASGACFAGKVGSNAGAKAASSDSAQLVSQLALAEQLASYGDANGDAIALVLAAKIKKGVGDAAKMDVSKSSKGGQGSDKKSGKGTNDASSMLTRAKALADDSPMVVAMIRDVEGMKSRGRTQGQVGGHEDLVMAHDTDTYIMKFDGDEEAEVLIIGDGDTDLDLYIYDQNDNLICSDADGTDLMYCSWTPAWTGKFKVSIENLGPIANIYEVYTN